MPTLINLLILILVVTSSAISIRSVEKDISKVDYRLSRPADRIGKDLDLPRLNYKWYNETLLAVAIDTKDNSVCGSAEFGFADKDKVWIYIANVDVRKDWRRKGVARRMLYWVMKYIECTRPEAKGAWLRVDSDNKFAIKAYKAVGFKYIGSNWAGKEYNFAQLGYGRELIGGSKCVGADDINDSWYFCSYGYPLNRGRIVRDLESGSACDENLTILKDAPQIKDEDGDLEDFLDEFKNGKNFKKYFPSS
ncbi:hypothetical protein FOL47_007685 [Perkinsus chesapeaki]|uniref:N-acetyltransferase domain-containing protein n=1 Tax=Perkinsus chesapeaki TaxID=330153 RepID=A0A7J6LJ93_PERCH|nr:hypothetical protein FOL47_007685 [Perkinsus chesapeaki]